MNVLVLSHMYPSEVNPTAGIFVHEQVLALRALGHDVRVVAPVGWAPPGTRRWPAHRRVPGMVRRDGVPVLHPRQVLLPGASLGRLAAPAMLAALAGPVRRIHRRWPVDVLHAHMVWPDGWVAARLGAALGVPTVATAHRADVLDLPAGATAGGPPSPARSARSTRWSRSAGPSAGPRRPWATAPTGASGAERRGPGDLRPRDPAVARARLGLPGGEPIVTYVGRLSRRKGVDTLVEAMGILGRRPTGAPLLAMVGEGALREELVARARVLGVEDRIRFVGKAPHDEVPWWMAAGDVFVLASLSEGLPTVVCEAMAAGRPVVATAVDGTPEIVDHGHTGLLVPPGDPPALAEALGRLVDTPELRERMGALAHARAFTWERNARAMVDIYSDLRAPGMPGRPRISTPNRPSVMARSWAGCAVTRLRRLSEASA